MKLFQNGEKPTPAILRTVHILEWLAGCPDGRSLSEIARSLRLPVSTTYETLRTLVGLRLLNRHPDNGRYSMGVRVLEIGMSYLSRTNLVQEFHAAGGPVARETGETVQLAVRDGHQVLHIAEVGGTRSVRVVTDIGRWLPCHTASTGKALLACLSDEDVRHLYRNAPLIRMTPYSLDSLPALLRELHTVRRRGYAIDAQETYEGVQCVGAVVYGSTGTPAAALSVAMPHTPTNSERAADVARVVCEAAAAISKRLGHMPGSGATGIHVPGAGRGAPEHRRSSSKGSYRGKRDTVRGVKR
jgi:IclR family transcriptional regulator, KDG regulon repressor